MSRTLAAGAANAAVPVLFLDLDDVLCMSSPYGGFDAIAAVNDRHVNPFQVYQRLFVPHATFALEQIHGAMESAVRYVISSTWRESFSRAQLDFVFRQAGLGFIADNLHDGELWRTPPKFGRSRRIDEIAEWLDRHHQGQPFAIVDDTHSGASLMPALLPAPMAPASVSATGPSTTVLPHPFTGRVVLCEENVGLTDDHVPFIVAALRRPVQVPGVPK